MTDIQSTVQDVQATAPYMWQIIAFCFIVASHFITNLIKKIRWFPAFVCDVKHSKCGKHTYRQLKSVYLITCAMCMSYGGVSWSLLQRYSNVEQVLVVTGLICVMQWLIAKFIFKMADGTKFEKPIAAIKGDLYVPGDATVLAKTVAYATGGGVDKRK